MGETRGQWVGGKDMQTYCVGEYRIGSVIKNTDEKTHRFSRGMNRRPHPAI